MDDARTVLKRLTAVEREVQDESGRWYLTRVLPYRTPDNRIEGVVVNFIDISDRKRMEEELRNAKIFAESIVETIQEPLLVLGPDLRVLSANPAFYEHFKVDPEDTISRRVYELGNNQWDIPQLRRLLEEVLPESKVVTEFEAEHEFEDIGRRVMLINARQIEHAQLVLLGIRDITKSKLSEAELRAAKEAAERANTVKGQFLGTMSHELRTPLHAVIGFAELVEIEAVGPTNTKQKEYLARIKRSIWNLVDIIDETLAFLQSEAEREKVTITEADLAEVVRDAVATLDTSVIAPGLELRLHGAEDTVPASTDPAKVRQIITNLVGNAVKYADGPVDVELEAHQHWVDFHVRDHGPGIPPDQLERIFEPFVRLDSSTSRSREGTGLGLAISRRFAQLLGGDVTVESVVGEGTSFTLRLPRSPRDLDEQEPDEREPDTTA
jgi:two-component system CheB/CheR fusion protein